MSFDAKLYNSLDKPWKSIQDFLSKALPSWGFTSEKPEVIMDVGCGPGYLSKNFILPCFPNLREMVAMDVTPSMIEEAKLQYSHPKIKYIVANIEDRSTVQQWTGGITKLTAIHSFNWVKNQRAGFETVHNLLKAGGEAAFVFPLDSPYYDGMIITGNNPKYRPYIGNADYCAPESYYNHCDSSHYQKMLTDIGFKVIHCKDAKKEDILSSDNEFRDIFYSVCPLVQHLPDHLKEDFKEDLFRNILKFSGRTEDGLPVHTCTMLEILVRKEE